MLLLSLVGEQPIPNLLPLWQLPEYTAGQFAATETTRRHAEMLVRAVENDPRLKHLAVQPVLVVEAYDLNKARRTLAKALSEHLGKGEEVCLNFTGGTKVMGAAALQTAYGTGIQLMYVCTELNEIIYYQSDGVETFRHTIDVKIGVQQYLEACGLEVRLPNPQAAPPPKAGDWLEQKVYKAALDCGSFDDVQRNVKVVRHLAAGAYVTNELDVVVSRNGHLTVCSCKSGQNLSKEVLYELSAISARENLGIYCGKVLATNLEELPPGIQERARSSRICVVPKGQLEQVGFYLMQETK